MGRHNDDWSRNESLSADDDDRPQGVRRRSPASSNLYLNVFIVTALLACGGYLALNHWQPDHTQLRPRISEPALPLPPPQLATPALQPHASIAQPLSDCIKDGNLIDESVVRCRFGQHPQPRVDPDAQGLVSTAYMAQFKAGQQRAIKRKEQSMENQLIPQWDGNGLYHAQWQVVDNQIDSTSVCANYRRGSIEFRECRKGAKVWFRDQCRKGGDDRSHQRYCSAASGFNPLS